MRRLEVLAEPVVHLLRRTDVAVIAATLAPLPDDSQVVQVVPLEYGEDGPTPGRLEDQREGAEPRGAPLEGVVRGGYVCTTASAVCRSWVC